MKLIESSVFEITANDPLHAIEKAGRTCYKSEKSKNKQSSLGFVKRLIKNKHFAMLEHGEVTFKVVGINVDELIYLPYVRSYGYDGDKTNYKSMYLITVSLSHLYNPVYSGTALINLLRSMYESYLKDSTIEYTEPDQSGYIHLIENESNLIMAVGELAAYMNCDPYQIWATIRSRSFKFICDRGVSHELVRHRCSFAQESTRYCNYSLAKFDNEITFIIPSTFDSWDNYAKDIFHQSLTAAEIAYMRLLDSGLKPEQARSVLPNAVKTEVVMTAPIYQWYHFFDIRSKGVTGPPHPDMKKVADEAHQIFEAREDSIKIRLAQAKKYTESIRAMCI